MAQTYKYPENITDYTHVAIMVSASKSDYPMNLFLHVPQGLPIADALQYGSSNLGALGSVTQNMLSNIDSGMGIIEAGKKTIGGVVDKFKNMSDKTTSAAALAQIAAKGIGIPIPGAEALAEAVMYSKRAVLNPNQVTTFNGSNVRSFAMEFRFVATSFQETNMISEMIQKLRYNAYPDGDQFVLKYPSEFKIEVLTNKGVRNPYYAPLYKCFLMNMSTVYNTTSNAFYSDGAPLEINLSLSFQETKALTRQDLLDMDQDGMPGGTSDSSFGGGE